MKKQTKMMAVLSAAALMTAVAPNLGGLAGSAHTVYARSNGWVQEDGNWHFYESEDYYLTDTWKKHGRDWYYLDSDGLVATDQIIDEYYVGADGKRTAEKWVSVPNEDDWDQWDAPEFFWYYFGKNGKMVTSKFQAVEGNWYYFNEEGRMQTGLIEVDGATYYLGDSTDGVMKRGWIELENTSDDPDSETAWHYFESDGRMVENDVDKKIKGDYYTFVDGRMQTGWFKLPVVNTATGSDAAQAVTGIEGYQYYEEETGKRANGWFRMEGAPGISTEDETYSFYFKNGKPYHASTGLELFTIDSKKYAFNTKGEMQTGLQSVNVDEGTAFFYFGDDGVMKTGKQVIYNEDEGENENWFFTTDGSKKGQGFHGVRDNLVYVNGRRQDADVELRYAPVALDETQYLVNVSGVIQKAGTSSTSASKPELGKGFKDFKDDNGQIWTVDVNGIVQK